jgi:hypothetical protein
VTNPANPPAAVEYAPVHQASGRPSSVTNLAGIGIVVGALGVLCKPAGVLINLFIPLPQSNPVIDAFRNEPLLRAFMLFSGVTGTLISVLLLLSSLGCLALRPWARTGMLGYAFLALLMTVVEQVVSYYVVAPEVERAMRQSGMPQPPGMALMSGWVGITIGLVIRLWYPPLILYYFTRPRAREAFELGLPGKGI